MKKTTKNSIKYALKLWGRVAFAVIMCAVLYFSLHMLVSALCSREVGYRIYEKDESGSLIEVDSHYYEVGEDASMTVTLLEGQTRQPIKELPNTAATIFNVISLILMLAVLAVFPYDRMWKLGARDENMVQCGKKKADNLRGFKIGLMASIPSAILYLLLIFTKFGWVPSWYMTVFRACNMPYLPFINMFFTVSTTVPQAPWYAFVAVLLTVFYVPAVCALGYRLGRKGFSLHEHAVYKQNKDNKS